MGPAIDEDLEEAFKDEAKPPPGCQTLTLTADQLNHLLALQAQRASPGCRVKKVHYVMEPGQGQRPKRPNRQEEELDEEEGE